MVEAQELRKLGRSKQTYEKVRNFILEVLPGSKDLQPSESAGGVAVLLIKQKHGELHDLGIIPEKRDDWKWETNAYRILIPMVKRQLENLVKAGKAEKWMSMTPATSRINFSGRIAVYRKV